MRFGVRLPAAFFDRPCLEIAPELVGMVLHRRRSDGSVLAGRLVEVEAYLGDGSDPGSHSHRGPTPRNASMFGPPARLYVYRSYGIHRCLNLVCESRGSGAAILLRAVEPVAGLDAMRQNRGLAPERGGSWIATGPGRLAEAFGIEMHHDGASVVSGEFSLRRPDNDMKPLQVAHGPRVGLGRGQALPYRFYAESNAWVSRWRPGRSITRRSGG